jgi:transcriptional regulator with GAF, ATPase, and Fis domain
VFEAAEQVLKGSRVVAGMDEVEVEQIRAEVEWQRGEFQVASRRMADLYTMGKETGNDRCRAAALIAALRSECEVMGGMGRAEMARELREIAADGESYEEAMAAGYFSAQEKLAAGRIDEAAGLLRQTVSEAETRDAGAWVMRAGTALWRILEDQGEEAEKADLERKLVSLAEQALASFEDANLRKRFERSEWCEVYRAVINRPRPNRERSTERSQEAPPSPPSLPLAPEPAGGGTSLDPVIVGSGAAAKRLLVEVQVAARGDVGVLIQGESGTGKELVARRIHDFSSRKGGPFVAIDCGAVPESLIESELFGYGRGAFTGAERDKVGIFEAAEQGTVFLDEIGNAGFNFQSKLLRVLQEREVRRVGETRTRPLNVRVLAATNVDLREEVTRGRFREDLYYRLGVLTVTVPPLRDRREDIPALAGAFLDEIRRSGQQVGPLSREALAALCAHPWPGNVRELKNALQAAALASAGGTVRPSHLPAAVAPGRQGRSPHVPDVPEKSRILEALRQAGGDKTQACRILGWNRMKLYRRMKAHGIPLVPSESPGSV